MKYTGIGASSGIAIGRAVKKAIEREPEKYLIQDAQLEIIRLKEARKQYQATLEDLIQKLDADAKENQEILESYKTFSDDDYFFEEVERSIEQNCINAEWALKEAIDAYIAILGEVEDEYIGQRVVDIRDIGGRICYILMGIEQIELSALDKDTVFLSKELTPTEMMQMGKKTIAGVVSELGGKTSHVAIIARTKGIPAVMGIEGIYGKIENGDILILDGDKGTLIQNPGTEEILFYQEKMVRAAEENEIYRQLKGSETYTKDGIRIELAANIGSIDDISAVIENDAEGIGLFRTELLFMDRKSMPTEEEQFKAYKTAAEKMTGKPVIIRTLDIGGDKTVPYLDIPKEENPFLGYRAIRMCLKDRHIFKTQLRAILRASVFGNLKIMFPMISGIEETRAAKQILDEVKKELRSENIIFDEKIPVGIMIEVPSAAICSEQLAREVDFFSIGTNDLVQYTLAVDRGNEKVSGLYNYFHPAVLRLIYDVIKNSHQAGIWTGICGEAANDPLMAALLVSMGIDELSVNPMSVLKIRWLVKQLESQNIKNIMEDTLKQLASPKEIEESLKQFIPAVFL